MIIGIKYCGGCNPTYQRIECVSKIKRKYPEHDYVCAIPGKKTDVLLIVCGCASVCAAKENLCGKVRFCLSCMKDFVEVERYLESQKNTAERKNIIKYKQNINTVRIGAHASIKHLFIKDEVERFAAMTGDKNKLHIEQTFAEKQIFEKPVVHGILAASLMSSVMGTMLPGHGTILMEDQITYASPVFFGDTIHATVWFVSCREAKTRYVGYFYGECRNQNNEITAYGYFKQMMMKSLFWVENPQDIVDVEIIRKGNR